MVGFQSVGITLIGGRVREPGKWRRRNEAVLGDVEEFGERSAGVVEPGKRNNLFIGGIGPKDGFWMVAVVSDLVPVDGGRGYREGLHGPSLGPGLRSRTLARVIGDWLARVGSAGLRSSFHPVRSMTLGGSARKWRMIWEHCCGIRMIHAMVSFRLGESRNQLRGAWAQFAFKPRTGPPNTTFQTQHYGNSQEARR